MATPTISNSYVGDGSTVLYSFTFPYIEILDVKVTIDKVPTTEYSFANATTIQLSSAPANGAAITIFRSTDNSDLKAAFFPGSAIRARDLNDNFTQSLYVVQEATINSVSAEEAAETALLAAQQAQASADSAAADAAQAAQDASDAAANIDGVAEDAAAAQAAASAAQAAATAAQAAADDASAKADQAALDAAAAQQAAQDVADAVLDGGVISVNGKTGVVVLTTNDVVDLTTLPTLPE